MEDLFNKELAKKTVNQLKEYKKSRNLEWQGMKCRKFFSEDKCQLERSEIKVALYINAIADNLTELKNHNVVLVHRISKNERNGI